MSVAVHVCKSLGDGFCGVDVYSDHGNVLCRYNYIDDLSTNTEAKSSYFVVDRNYRVLKCTNETLRENLSIIVESCIGGIGSVETPIHMVSIVPRVYSEFKDECTLVKGESLPTGGVGNRFVITF